MAADKMGGKKELVIGRQHDQCKSCVRGATFEVTLRHELASDKAEYMQWDIHQSFRYTYQHERECS
jgi:hypothetical protein